MTVSIPTPARTLLSTLLAAAALAFAPVSASAWAQTATGAPIPDQAAAVAALGGDAAAGERTFRKCRACHLLEEEQNRIGPHLMHVIGRPAGSVEGYQYSDANKNSGLTWTVDILQAYLKDPRGYLPGTKMTFRGLERDQEINDLLAYMLQAGGGVYSAPN